MVIGATIETLAAECVLDLNEAERREMTEIIRMLPPEDPFKADDDSFFTDIGLARCHVPKRLVALLLDFRRRSNDYGVLLIRGLPVDPILPATPSLRCLPLEKTRYSEYSLLLLMTYLGEPIGYANLCEGAIIQDIAPVAGYEEKFAYTGSVDHPLHNEDVAIANPPDYVGLYCLRSDHDKVAATVSSSIRRAAAALSDEVIEELSRPAFRTQLPSAFDSDLNSVARFSEAHSVLTGRKDRLHVTVDFGDTEALDANAASALAILEQALGDARAAYVLSPGDLMIIDNRIALHGRTTIEPRYDGEDRWLQRMLIVENFRASQSIRESDSHVYHAI